MYPGVSYLNRHRRAPPCTPEHSRRVYITFHGSVMHCAHFSFDLLGPHKGFLNLTECAHVHEFRKHLLTEFTVYLKIEKNRKCPLGGPYITKWPNQCPLLHADLRSDSDHANFARSKLVQDQISTVICFVRGLSAC